MNYLIPLGIVAYGIAQFVMNWNSGMDMTFIIKNALAILGGGGFAAYNAKDSISSFISGFTKTKTSETIKNTDVVYIPSTVEEKDFACLIHLKNRVHAANSQEGIETVEKLNQIIFSLADKKVVSE